MRVARIQARWSVSNTILLPLMLELHSLAQQPQTNKQEIYGLLSTHQFEQAEKLSTSMLTKKSNDCGLNVLLGIGLRGEAKQDAALRAFQSAADRCPDLIAAAEGAVETAFLLHRPEAKSLFFRTIQLRPSEETGYAMLGAIDARAGDCVGAVENYAKAPGRIHQNPPALRQYSACLMELDRPAEATRCSHNCSSCRIKVSTV